MIRKIYLVSGSITSIIVGAFLIIFGESLLVGSILLVGPYTSFFIFFIAFSSLSCGIIYIIKRGYYNNNKYIRLITKWVQKRESLINNKKQKYLKFGKFFGIIFFSITAGPLITSIFIALLFQEIVKANYISIVSNCIFFIFWIAIYSGGLSIIFLYL